MTTPRITICIVSWNTADLLAACLRSIERNRNGLAVEVIVVDNASSDGTAERVRQDFPDVRLIANDKNRGFAAANNQAILEASGECILLLNPDTELQAGALSTCSDWFASHPNAGLIGCRHLNSDRTIQPSVRRFPRLRDQLLILTKLAKLAPRLPALDAYYCRDLDLSAPLLVEQVAGSFFFLRRELLDEVGLLDEGFFIWFEEVDYCKRTHNAGWEIWYLPRATILHHGGQSFAQQLTLQKQIRYLKSAWRYFRKHGFTW